MDAGEQGGRGSDAESFGDGQEIRVADSTCLSVHGEGVRVRPRAPGAFGEMRVRQVVGRREFPASAFGSGGEMQGK